MDYIPKIMEQEYMISRGMSHLRAAHTKQKLSDSLSSNITPMLVIVLTHICGSQPGHHWFE